MVMKLLLITLEVSVLCLVAMSAFGEDTKSNLTDGWYTLRLNTRGFEEATAPTPTTTAVVTAPTTTTKYKADAKSKFHIVEETGENANKKLKLYFTKVVKKEGDGYVKENELYFVNAAEFNNSYYWRRTRIVHGLLVMPFKLRTKDGTLSGESTLGYYAGIESDFLQAKSSYVAAAGLTLIPITDTAGKTDQKTGVTAALGWIFTTLDNFQIGAFVGVDHLGGDSGRAWKYENDPWVSISIGFNFAR
jgi:hypothetical protein